MSDEATPLLREGSSDASIHKPQSYGAHDGRDESQPEAASQGEPNDGDVTKSFKAVAVTILPMTIGIFLASMDSTIVLSSYASIGNELNQLQNTSWISTGYMLTLASFQPLYGKMSDIFGRKPCLLFAYLVFALGCLLCGLSRSMNELVVARAIAGIGGGGMTTVVSIIMSDIVPLRSRGTWQGLINIIWASGSATGAPLGGILTDSIGWRWAFLFQAPLTIVAFVSVSIALKLPKPAEADLRTQLKRVDFGGAFCLVFAILSLLLGLDHGGNVSWSDPMTISSLSTFVVMFSAFVVVETWIAKEPFAPSRIVVNPTLLATYLCNFFGIASSIATIFYVSLYLQAVRGGSAAMSGLALLPSIFAGVAGSLVGGLIMQATGKYHALTVWNYIAMLAGTITVALTTGLVVNSFVGLEIGIFVMAYGNGSGITTTLIGLIAHAGPADQAIATAVSYLFRSLGSVLGLSVGSTIFQNTLRRYLRQRLSGDDVEDIILHVRESLTYLEELDPATRAIVRTSYELSLQVTFWFAVGLALCTLISSLFMKEKALAR